MCIWTKSYFYYFLILVFCNQWSFLWHMILLLSYFIFWWKFLNEWRSIFLQEFKLNLVFYCLFLLNSSHVLNLNDVLQTLVISQIFKRSLSLYFSFFHNNDSVYMLKKINSVSHKHSGFISKQSVENFFEDLFLHICIESTYRIIHQHNVSLCIHSSS